MEQDTHKWVIKEVLNDQVYRQEDELVLEIVSFVRMNNGEWTGTYPQLLMELKEKDKYTNSTLSRKINTLCSVLRSDYGIEFETKKKSTGKIIRFFEN